MNSKVILQKLFDIASKQQKVLTKLAQAAQDPIVDYLKQAAQVAASNSGFTATEVIVDSSPGTSGTLPGSSDLITTDKGYRITIGGSPPDNKVRQKFIDTLKRQCATQHPGADWVNNLSITFS